VFGTDSPPRVSANLVGNDLQLAWYSSAAGFVVEAATQLTSPDWADLDPQPVIQRDGITNTTSVAIGGPQFFRLRVEP
jgi:hypothetical protein